MTDLVAHAQAVLDANSYAVLATAADDGAPWVTPLWFAPDDLDRLVWVSWPGARHSMLIERRPEVALTVFDSTAAPNQGTAVYASARARQCADGELDEALRIVNQRGDAQGLERFARERVTGHARLRLYVAEVTAMWVLDPDADVDQRVQVDR